MATSNLPDSLASGLDTTTALQAAEEALHHKQIQLDEAERLASIGSWEWDLSTNLIDWSLEYFRICGLQPQTQPISAELALSLLTTDDRQRFEAILRETLSSGRSYDAAFRVQRPDGTTRVLRCRGQVKYDSSGRIVRLVGTAADVTSRHEAEEKLRESEARLRELAEAVPQIVWVMDESGRVEYLNGRFFAYSGLEHRKLLPTADLIDAVCHPDERESVLQNWCETIERGCNCDVELRLRSADGTYRWFLVRGVPSRDADGRITRWFGTCTDIHEQKVASEALLERAREQALLADVGKALTSDHGLATELHQCCQAIVDHLGAAFARIWLVDATQEVLELRASAGLYTRLDGHHARVAVGQLKIGQIAEQRQPLLTNQVFGDPRVWDQEWARREGMVSFAGYPLICAGELVGVMAMFSRHPLSESAFTILASIADEIAVGVRRASAEARVSEKEQQVRLLLDSTAEAIYGIDTTGRCTFANPACLRLLGYQKLDAILGKNMHALVHHTRADGTPSLEEDWPVVQIARLDGRTLHLAQTVLWRADGSALLAELWAHPIYQNDVVIGSVVTFLDITERAAAERDLRVRVAAVEGTDDEVVITNQAGIIEYVNPSFTRTTGYAAEEVLGRTPAILKSGCHDELFYQELWDTILAGRVWRGEIVNRRKDGSLFTEEMTITPILNDERRVVRFVAIKRDVTERRHAEQINREHTRLREAVAALEQVLGVVGHELRTPLAGIRAMAEFLLASEKMRLADENRFLQSIDEEVVRMSAIVNDMLEAARLNSGAARWNWETFELKDVCHEAINVIDKIVDHEAIKLSCRIDPPDIPMRGDAGAIRRLILNLLTNAQKHTVTGEIAIVAGTTRVAAEEWIELIVRDTGCGIPPGILEKVGEAFALNSGVVGDSYVHGSGLGLAICKGIVAAHGGSLHIQSGPAGTTVLVRLKPDLETPCTSRRALDILRSAEN